MASNRDYLQRHPKLQSYLNAHPEVRQELMANPQAFVKSTQQLTNDGQPVKTGQSTSTTQPGKTPASPTADPSKPRP